MENMENEKKRSNVQKTVKLSYNILDYISSLCLISECKRVRSDAHAC